MTNKELEERLVVFSGNIIDIAQNLVENKTSNNISGQMIRCGTAVALIYGEAQSAESRKDFIHKISMILKELRECNIGLKLIKHSRLYINPEAIEIVMKENNELISIFVKSIETAKRNLANSEKRK